MRHIIAAGTGISPRALTDSDISSYDTIVRGIYETATAHQPWPGILVQLIRHFGLLGAAATLKQDGPQDIGFLISGHGDDKVLPIQHETWRRFDPFTNISPNIAAVAAAAAVRGRAPFPDALLSEQDHWATGYHTLGINFSDGDGRLIRLRLFRRGDASPFKHEAQDTLVRLRPHLQGALGLSTQLARKEEERRLYEVAMERVGVGLIVIRADRRILYRNAIAIAMMQNHDGIRLTENRLEGCTPTDTRHLHTLVSASLATANEVFAGTLARPSGARDLAVMVHAMPEIVDQNEHPPSAAAVFVRDMDSRTAMDDKILAEMFGFTATETRLAAALAGGRSMDEAAAALGIRVTTARAHLRAIFAKAGVSRQAELIRMLLI